MKISEYLNKTHVFIISGDRILQEYSNGECEFDFIKFNIKDILWVRQAYKLKQTYHILLTIIWVYNMRVYITFRVPKLMNNLKDVSYNNDIQVHNNVNIG